MIQIKKNKNGSAVLISSVIVASVVLAVVLSMMLVVLDSQSGVQSFSGSLQSFYSAESGVSEALIRLRKEPDNFIFPELSVGNVSSTVNFVDLSGNCGPTLECDSYLEATASTTKASRKVRYSCSQSIENCIWSEVVP